MVQVKFTLQKGFQISHEKPFGSKWNNVEQQNGRFYKAAFFGGNRENLEFTEF